MWLRSEKRKNFRSICVNKLRRVKKETKKTNQKTPLKEKPKQQQSSLVSDECKENYQAQIVPDFALLEKKCRKSKSGCGS